MSRAVYIVDGCRTPFLKAGNQRGAFSAGDLAVACGRHLLMRQPFNPTDIDEVIVGCMMPGPNEATIGRIIALRLGCGDHVPGWTVQRNCASGMQALDNAAQNIAQGRSDLVLAGGTDAMSHAPLLFNEDMTNWFMDFSTSQSISHKLYLLTQLRPRHLKPTIALLCGLTDPLVGLNMGQTAENLAELFSVTRAQMDAFSVKSHRRLAKAFDEDLMRTEICPLYDPSGHFYQEDTGLRRDSSPEKLAKLTPFFDKKFGRVTAANSSQITDGSAMLLLASEAAIKKHNLPILAKIQDTQWAGLDPTCMGLGPVHAATPLLQRNKLSLNDIDYWEINEAFATQVIACQRAWQDADYCKNYLNLNQPLGELSNTKLNINGGAIATGHPIGASGARIVLHLAEVMKRCEAQRGIAAICIGGGQGGAMLLERPAGGTL